MSPESADPTKGGASTAAATETTPLLFTPATGRPLGVHDSSRTPPHADGHRPFDTSEQNASPQNEEVEEMPMPYTQVFLLCYASLAEPVAYFSIFPFVNEMIERNGKLPESDVGFWAGLIESLFSLVQMVLMILYGRAADRLGRKPVLIFSLAGIAVATALFGMSRQLWQMVLMRCLAGIFAGSVVTIRTMLSEICDKASQGRAFGWYMCVRNLGIALGPVIGGGLANPAEQFPGVFGGVAFFENHPYALSSYVAGSLVFSAALTSFFLNETLERTSYGTSKLSSPMSTWDVLSSPGVPTVLYIFGHTMLLALSYTAVSPVFYYTSIPTGGLSFSDQKIAATLFIAGSSQAIWMLLVFPPLQKKLGTGAVLMVCSVAWPIFMAVYPLLNELLRYGWTTTFWIVGPVLLILGSGVSMAFACVQLCVNDISPSSSVLATINALALTVNSGVRTFAPVVATSIFATGVKWGFADGHLVWFFIVALALALPVVVWFFLPPQIESHAGSRNKNKCGAADTQESREQQSGNSET